jgi:hypothetical protein
MDMAKEKGTEYLEENKDEMIDKTLEDIDPKKDD